VISKSISAMGLVSMEFALEQVQGSLVVSL